MFDLIAIIKTTGYIGIFSIIFAESGLLIGFFFPGDSLLFTAGFLASQGFLRISILMVGSFLAAVIGDSVGYSFGYRVGPKIFKKEDSLFFHKDHLTRAQKFYEKHGGKAIILARFMPIIRTFAPILAGVGKMRYGAFLSYNIVGGFLWSIGLSGLGYFLGSTIPNVDKYLLPIIVLIILLSIAPSVYHILKDRALRQHFWQTGVKIIKKISGSHTS
ncbi:MAG: VTT domain-containing protein [Candidatus Magasanikbacteria bacterium]|nr:VTT domain-containing protein [Candidatus Magasanikbacteria bacterium]